MCAPLADPADRLRALADLIEAGDLPESTLARLSRAVVLAERDHHILAASRIAGGVAALLEVLEAHGWRLDVWRSRGRCPEIADPALVALFEAGTLPSGRHVRRILSERTRDVTRHRLA